MKKYGTKSEILLYQQLMTQTIMMKDIYGNQIQLDDDLPLKNR